MGKADRRGGRAGTAVVGLVLSLVVYAQRTGQADDGGHEDVQPVGVVVTLMSLPGMLRNIARFIAFARLVDHTRSDVDRRPPR
jgi:hypothetical protein